ncbi:MAG TPA: hypothetical protein PLY86_05075 [bacterium]|nr:hypothetical protein [bacterium]
MNARMPKNRTSGIVSTVLVIVFAAGYGVCQDTGEATENKSVQKYESFELIVSRNIFNPNRRAKRVESAPPTVVHTPKVDEITYVGMIDTGAGTYAFFEGSNADYQRVLSVGDTIAGCTVTVIDSRHVSLLATETPLDVPVGSRIVREDRGQWEITAAVSRRPPPARETEKPKETVEPAAAKAEPATGGDGGDLLKRMMERRKQETKK